MKEDIKKMILTQLKVGEEYKTFLDGISTPVIREWAYLCMTEGMALDRIRQVCAAAESNTAQASMVFLEERERNLRERYENNRDLREQYTDLLRRVEIMYERTSALEEGLSSKLTDAMQAKDRAVGQMMETKDRMIRDREKQIEELKEEIAELKKEKKSLFEKNDGMREKIFSLEEKVRTAQDRLSFMDQKGTQTECTDTPVMTASPAGGSGIRTGAGSFGTTDGGIQVIPYNKLLYDSGNHRRRRGFFRKEDRTADEFIRLYIENKDYSEEQKEFLIKCLEQGDSLDIIREFASPRLTVANMDWLRRITYRRMR